MFFGGGEKGILAIVAGAAHQVDELVELAPACGADQVGFWRVTKLNEASDKGSVGLFEFLHQYPQEKRSVLGCEARLAEEA